MIESPDTLTHGRWVLDPRRRVLVWEPGAEVLEWKPGGCRDCGGKRKPRRWYCEPCRAMRRLESQRRYDQGKRMWGAA